MNYTHVPDARVFLNGVEQEPTLQHRIDSMVWLGANARDIQRYANKFGGYLEVKLRTNPPLG